MPQNKKNAVSTIDPIIQHPKQLAEYEKNNITRKNTMYSNIQSETVELAILKAGEEKCTFNDDAAINLEPLSRPVYEFIDLFSDDNGDTVSIIDGNSTTAGIHMFRTSTPVHGLTSHVPVKTSVHVFRLKTGSSTPVTGETNSDAGANSVSKEQAPNNESDVHSKIADSNEKGELNEGFVNEDVAEEIECDSANNLSNTAVKKYDVSENTSQQVGLAENITVKSISDKVPTNEGIPIQYKAIQITFL